MCFLLLRSVSKSHWLLVSKHTLKVWKTVFEQVPKFFYNLFYLMPHWQVVPPRQDLWGASVPPASSAGWLQGWGTWAWSGPESLNPPRQRPLIIYLDVFKTLQYAFSKYPTHNFKRKERNKQNNMRTVGGSCERRTSSYIQTYRKCALFSFLRNHKNCNKV